MTIRKKKSYCDFKLILSLWWCVNLFNACFPPSKREIYLGNDCAMLTVVDLPDFLLCHTWDLTSQKRGMVILTSVFFWIYSVFFWQFTTSPPLSTLRKDVSPVCYKLRFHWSLGDLKRGRVSYFKNGGNSLPRNFPANPRINRLTWSVGYYFQVPPRYIRQLSDHYRNDFEMFGY